VSWFRFERKRPTPPRSGGEGAATGGAEPESVRLRYLALENLLEDLVPGGSYRFLDLGPAVGGNIEFLSRFALSVQVADLAATLASPEPRAWEKALDALDPGPDHPGYHAVLAWDLLNYLPLDRVKELGRRMAGFVRDGGRLFSLIYYSKEMPAEPLRFRIADRRTLVYERPAGQRPAPRYPQGVIRGAFPDFRVDRGYLLKTGLQELLLQREVAEPDAEGPDPADDTSVY
jgi:hypothetical protein